MTAPLRQICLHQGAAFVPAQIARDAIGVSHLHNDGNAQCRFSPVARPAAAAVAVAVVARGRVIYRRQCAVNGAGGGFIGAPLRGLISAE